MIPLNRLTATLFLGSFCACAQIESNPDEANSLCEQATRKFEKLEVAKGRAFVDKGEFMPACKDNKKKPLSYWKCMNEQADQNVALNIAHTECKKGEPTD